MSVLAQFYSFQITLDFTDNKYQNFLDNFKTYNQNITYRTDLESNKLTINDKTRVRVI